MDDFAFLRETVRRSWQKNRPAKVTAAVSGGADSVALLWALHALSAQEGFALSAVHVDHGLRAESQQDAAFVAALCEKLSVPCRVLHVHLQGSSEEEARNARYGAILQALAHQGNCCLALAHHRRDQAETMLLHLFRGSGAEGLTGMAEYSARADSGSVTFWRPLLTADPCVIRSALRQQGLAWREDATNAEDDYLRNFLRHRVLPVIAERIPDAEEAMGRAAEILADENDYLSREARRFLRLNGCLLDPVRWLRYEPLRTLHPALRRRVLRMICPVKLSFAQTEALDAALPGATVNLPEGWRASCTADRLHFLPPAGMRFPPIALAAPSVLPFDGTRGDGKRTQAMPRDCFAQCVLRTWRTGDRIRPLGAGGHQSLQDYFVNKKVPQPFRACLPLLCIGQEVIWAIGVGPSESARVAGGTDAVLIEYRGFLPFDAGTPFPNTDTKGVDDQ